MTTMDDVDASPIPGSLLLRPAIPSVDGGQLPSHPGPAVGRPSAEPFGSGGTRATVPHGPLAS